MIKFMSFTLLPLSKSQSSMGSLFFKMKQQQTGKAFLGFKYQGSPYPSRQFRAQFLNSGGCPTMRAHIYGNKVL